MWQVDRWREREAGGTGAPLRQPNELMAVQTGAALAAGCTSATLTNPLDVIKTRLQVRSRSLRTGAKVELGPLGAYPPSQLIAMVMILKRVEVFMHLDIACNS